MPDRFVVTIALDRLQPRLNWSDGSVVSRAHVIAWLTAVGFSGTENPAVWKGSQEAVDQLHDDEIVRWEHLPDETGDRERWHEG